MVRLVISYTEHVFPRETLKNRFSHIKVAEHYFKVVFIRTHGVMKSNQDEICLYSMSTCKVHLLGVINFGVGASLGEVNTKRSSFVQGVLYIFWMTMWNFLFILFEFLKTVHKPCDKSSLIFFLFLVPMHMFFFRTITQLYLLIL